MSKIYLGILDKKRQETFSTLAQFKDFGYLAGGTGLALQIKHRKSFDFDVFLSKPIDNRFRLKVLNVFGDVRIDMYTEDQMIFYTKADVGITFLWYYFDRLFPLIETGVLGLASPMDIAADKAYSIGRRAVWRDYVDMYFLLKRNIADLPKIISLTKKKFKGGFNESLFLEQLAYFKDLEVSPIEFITERPTTAEVKSFLEKKVELYIKKRFSTIKQK